MKFCLTFKHLWCLVRVQENSNNRTFSFIVKARVRIYLDVNKPRFLTSNIYSSTYPYVLRPQHHRLVYAGKRLIHILRHLNNILVGSRRIYAISILGRYHNEASFGGCMIDLGEIS